MTSVYVEALHRALPRLLASFNADPTSPLAGVGDRYHWGWKLIDFPNGTFQGAVHGLAILSSLKLLPDYVGEAQVLSLIRGIIAGLGSITARNGSLDEALPHEASYCVTALVAADVLAAREWLGDALSQEERQEWLETVRPLIGFLMRQDEHHALISNHLASGALAMFRWHAASGDSTSETRGRLWLDRILQQQSEEGWFREYGGADPGYQSWCTTQLAQLHILRPDLGLSDALGKSLAFLSYAAHPDGSFGGAYGTRNTRFLLPGGVELLGRQDDNAGALASFARKSIRDFACVSLDSIDAGNLVPFFNDYALAASAERQNGELPTGVKLPCHSNCGRKWFPDSGWLVDCGASHYSIINLKRGGAVLHFHNTVLCIDDPGVVVRDRDGRLYSSQPGQAEAFPDNITSVDRISVRFGLMPVVRPVPGAFDFVILRLLSITLFRSLYLGNLVKRALARFLISRSPRPVGNIVRNIKLGEDLSINDTIEEPADFRQVSNTRNFSAIHMASQGYWQRNDASPTENEQ